MASNPLMFPIPSEESRFVEFYDKLNEDFFKKLIVNVEENEESRRNGVKSSLETGAGDENREEEEDDDERRDEGEEDVVDEDDDEEEFSFVYLNTDGTLITAEEAFKDGQIRPSFPLFNRDLLFGDEAITNRDLSTPGDVDRYTATAASLRPPLRKVFVEDRSGGEEAAATSTAGRTVVEASPARCDKSNSTGFSKLWRFRDLVHRSNSDGRDAFVFLKNQPITKQSVTNTSQGKNKTASSVGRHFGREKASREAGKRKSYLPYKQVGLFTNVNELSRNLHPF